VRISFAHDQTVQQWLKSKGFLYVTSNASSRLSSTRITLSERQKEMLPLKKKYTKKLYKENMSEVEKFYIDLKVMNKSMEEFEKNNDNTL